MVGPALVELWQRARSDAPGARDALLRELYDHVRKHIYFLLGGGALADDAVQETMIALHHGLSEFRGDANPRTWALTIATRIARKLRRRESRYVASDEVDATVFAVDMTSAAELVLLRRALAHLSPKKRDAFVLMTIFELTAEEAGRALSTFANTAASRNRHARAELEEYLQRHGGREK